MPKTNMNYSNTIIYRLVCKDLNITDCYVGHTTRFRKRKNKHKYHIYDVENKYGKHNFKVYQYIINNGGWENWLMIEVEKYPCDDGNEARARERYWYETLEATLNTDTPNQTTKEWRDKTNYNQKNYERNKIKINARTKAYYLLHIDEIHEKNKETITCDCGCSITKVNLIRHSKTKKHQLYINEK